MLRNTAQTYGSVAKLLHWLVFILVAYLLLSGWFAEDLGKQLEHQLMDLHKAIGITVLALIVVRWLWRIANAVPAMPDAMTANEKRLAQVMHLGLYLMLVAQPLTGLLMVEFAGRGIDVFGLFSVPALLAKDKATSHLFGELHEIGQIVLAVLIALHAAAALYHHYVRKDDVLRRMTSG